jgi:hypothetical protein
MKSGPVFHLSLELKSSFLVDLAFKVLANIIDWNRGDLVNQCQN